MNCQTCKQDAVKSHAGGNEFWYCRTCKVEVIAKDYPTLTIEASIAAAKDLYNRVGHVVPILVSKPSATITIGSLYLKHSFFYDVKREIDPHGGSSLIIPVYAPNNILGHLSVMHHTWVIPNALYPDYLDKWLPGQVHPGDNFYGIDRSIDQVRLAGNWFDSFGLSTEEGLINMASLIAREGGTATNAYLHPTDFLNLEISLGNPASPGSPILINTPYSGVLCKPDMDCPMGKVYVVDLGTWVLNDTRNILYCTNLASNGVVIL